MRFTIALFDLPAPFAEAGISRARSTPWRRNLRLYGYGAKGFTLSMIEAAIELGGHVRPHLRRPRRPARARPDGR